MDQNIVAVIGGSGLYELTGLLEIEQIDCNTPFGEPSSPITIGRVGNTKYAFIARHGIGHTLLPSEVNYRANIYALKELGASWCISISAVGSLKEEIVPGHLVVPDQLIDRTKGRESTFFGKGIVGHVPFAKPFCPVLSQALFEIADTLAPKYNSKVHLGGTYLCMEGPAFSTQAESHLYRSFGADIIGMTNLPEAKLAREAQLSYATVGLVTDYDCWRSADADVNVDELLKTLKQNGDFAKDIVFNSAARIPSLEQPELVKKALKYAIISNPEKISLEAKERLKAILPSLITFRAPI